jgi:hypothetical protein
MFPYLAPIKDWTVEVFKDREANPIDDNFIRPWMILTSGAKVLKTKVPTDSKTAGADYEALISNSGSIEQYSGCIIKNNTTPELNYQLNETIVGFDFNGKAIKVDGEVNRRISTPIIESVEISTDGANNTLKTAKINIRCFSLKQYEMFELFFCKPGMNLLFEWGNNVLSRKHYSNSKDAERPAPITDVTSVLVPKNNYDTYKQNFSNYYRVNNETFRTYMNNVEASRGTYDLIAGKVTNYSFSIDNGTYTAMIEISQGNQMTLAIPVNTAEPKATTKGQNKDIKHGIDQWVLELCANLGINYDSFKTIVGKEWENDFYNWGKVNEDKKDEGSSKDAYISLRFILKILLNYMLYKDTSFVRKDWEFTLPTYTDKNGKEIECIPFRFHKDMISSSPEIIFPNENLPNFIGDTDNITIIIDPKSRMDGRINGYSILENTPLSLKRGSGVININPSDPNSPDIKNGNALNIFINYKSVAQIWKKSYTRIDFLKSILAILNSNTYGLARFQYIPQVTGGNATIVDIKSTGDADTSTQPYRFKVNSVNSIVTEFSFDFQMSNLIAGRTVFNAQKFLIDALKKVDPKNRTQIDLPPDAYKSFDNSMFGNADGWYSINVIDLEALKKTFKDAQTTGTIAGKSSDGKKNTAKGLGEIIKGKTIKFKEAGKDKLKILIFKDIDVVTKLVTSADNQKSTLTPIDVSLTINGLSGLSCGEYFKLEGVPEIYNKIGVFQITNTSHTINNDGWITKIQAGFRINKK